MKERAPAKKAPGITPAVGPLRVQRCACGGSAGLGGECAECRKKRATELQLLPESRLGHDFGRVQVHASTSGPLLQRAPAQVKRCDSDKEQKLLEAHRLGIAMVGRAAAATGTSAETIEEPLKTLGQRWFKLEPPTETNGMLKLWQHVFSSVASLAECADATRYRCGWRNDQLAISWPGRMSVLQPLFDLADAEQRAAVLVHEWGHMCGRGIRRLFERYCGREKFAAYPPKKLVQMPDAYMGFIFELSERKELPGGLCMGDVPDAPGGEIPADLFGP